MASNSQGLVVTVEVYQGDSLLQVDESREARITIGQSPTATVRLVHPGIAEFHAVISVEGEGVVRLQDLSGSPGIRANGQQISTIELTTGTTVELGDLRCMIHVDEDTAFEGEESTQRLPSPKTFKQAQALAALTEEDPTDESEAFFVPDTEEPVTEPEPTEDVLDFVFRAGTGSSSLGIDLGAQKVLEVNQVWGDWLVATKHFQTGQANVTVGSVTGLQCHVFGKPLGFVSEPVARVLSWLSLFGCDIRTTLRSDFLGPNPDLASTKPTYSLFHWNGEDYVAHLQPSWHGTFALIGTERFTLDELISQGKAQVQGNDCILPVRDDTRLMIDVDGLCFYAQLVPPSKVLAGRRNSGFDYLFAGLLGLASFVAAIMAFTTYLLPPPAPLEVAQINERFVELLLESRSIEPPEPVETEVTEVAPRPKDDASTEPQATTSRDSASTKSSANNRRPKTAKQKKDQRVAERAGVLGALRGGSGLGGFGDAVPTSIASGVVGSASGKGPAIGATGLDSRGDEFGTPGGSAQDVGTASPLGSPGGDSGSGSSGSAGSGLGKKSTGKIATVRGDSIILGAMDRAVVDQVIKRRIAQIRNCYQRELTRNPQLSGKVVIKFVISGDGSVRSVSTKSSTLNAPAVEQCMIGHFKQMQFPQPKGGGTVIVSYPFIFSSG